MNEKHLISIGSVSPYSIINQIIIEKAHRDSKLTPEQKAERAESRRLSEEQRVMRVKVLKSICPNCDSKLTRGKRTRKNNYKRSWVCNGCGNSYLL